MTAAIALLMVSILLFTLGRKHKAEDGAQHCIGMSFVALLLALMLFVLDVKAALAAADAPAEAEAEVYVVIKQATLVRALALMHAQAVEICQLREDLKKASVPKECI